MNGPAPDCVPPPGGASEPAPPSEPEIRPAGQRLGPSLPARSPAIGQPCGACCRSNRAGLFTVATQRSAAKARALIRRDGADGDARDRSVPPSASRRKSPARRKQRCTLRAWTFEPDTETVQTVRANCLRGVRSFSTCERMLAREGGSPVRMRDTARSSNLRRQDDRGCLNERPRRERMRDMWLTMTATSRAAKR